MTRTFIALELDASVQRFLAAALQQLARKLPSVRWVDPASIHLTLAFLGDLTDEQVAEAIASADSAARQVSPFEYRLARLGTFGSPERPRVIWMGVKDPSGSLPRLHHLLRRELEPRGLPVETRGFSPHLTLARLKTPLPFKEQQTLNDLLDEQPIQASLPCRVASVSTIKSELLRSGALYTPLHHSLLVDPR